MWKLLSRILITIPAVLTQVFWMLIVLGFLEPYTDWINLGLLIVSFLFVIYIITKHDESAYRILWLMIILTFPLPGAYLYILFGNQRSARPIQKQLEVSENELKVYTDPLQSDLLNEIAENDERLALALKLTQQKTGFPLVKNESAEYFPLGEKMHKNMLEELKKAKKFIFAEYFIVEDGLMWDSMVKIMSEKVKQGVEVYFMYDDVGSISTYSKRNVRALKSKGIKCMRFNPIKFVKGTLNYRDHRKMLVIDGEIAYSGGVNLADEYINRIKKYGHWKDIGFCVRGAAAQVYAQMFVEFWNAFSKEQLNPEKYFPPFPENISKANDGYVLSYFDSPVTLETYSNDLYIDLLYQANKTAWFYTPYLMPGDFLLQAFLKAAERGVDIRIIMPGIPDKKLIYRMSRSYYRTLLDAGVKIYEYSPGFVHAKGCIIDGKIATIGTVNLDYRSLFLHFENNSVFYQSSIIKDFETDFLKTQSKCRERTLGNIPSGFFSWLLDGILRIFAPLC